MIVFADLLEQAKRDGVSHPLNLPFLLESDAPDALGILLIHGFCATPHEMRALGDELHAQGHTVLGIRLPGHGTSPENLKQKRLEDWQAATEQGYRLLAQRGLRVCAAGLSTGALLALNMALTQQLLGLVLYSPFLKLHHPLAPFAALLALLIPYQDRQLNQEAQPFYYQRRPLKGIQQINRLRRHLRGKLAQITTPALLLSAAGDQTIDQASAFELYRRLGSTEKTFHCYGQEVPHVLTTTENPEQQDTFRRTAEFLLSLKAGPAAE